MVIENASGRVIALAGGDDTIEGFVHATQARRQPGSSFKPIVYAAALSTGMTQLDVVADAPISLPGGGGKPWRPRNYAGRYYGDVTLRRALALSLNSVAVRLAVRIGTDEVARTAAAMGIETPLRRDLSLALGASEITPLEAAVAYATIARIGVRPEPVLIERMSDARGHLIATAGGGVLGHGEAETRLPGGPGVRALRPGVAYQLADMLREVVRSGTARSAYAPDLDRAGKTGTTNDNVDAWFVGFTPRHTVAVWTGTDGTEPLGPRETGGRAALPAWRAIVEALGEREGARLPVPDEALLAEHGGDWIALERGHVPRSVLAIDDPPEDAPLPPFTGPEAPPPSGAPALAEEHTLRPAELSEN